MVKEVVTDAIRLSREMSISFDVHAESFEFYNQCSTENSRIFIIPTLTINTCNPSYLRLARTKP